MKVRWLKRLVIALAAIAGVLVALAVLLVVLVNRGEVSDRMKAWVLPQFEQRLGRKIDVQGIHVSVLPNPRVVLEKVRVEGTREVPLAEIPKTDVELAWWPLLRSLGKEVQVVGVDLHGAELNLIRQPNGQWNFEGLGQNGSPSKREVVVKRITTHDGRVRIVDQSTGHGEATVALTHLDATATNVGPGLPMSLRGSGAFASDEPNVQLEASVDRLPASAQELKSGRWPAVTGMLSLTNAQVPRLEAFLPARLGAMITGGLLNLDANLETGPDGALLVTGNAKLAALRVRGEPASGGFDLGMRLEPENLRSPRIDVRNLRLKGPGLEVYGTASLSGQPTQMQFALKGPLLDLQTLLAALPESPQQAQAGARAGALPARMRQKIDAIRATGTIQFDKVVNGRLVATDVDARGQLKDGVLVLRQAGATFFQGRLDASGTQVNLLAAVPEWKLRTRLQGVDAATAMSSLSGKPSPLQGRLDASVNLDGKGADWNAIAPTVTGQGTLNLRNGVLTTTDLGEALAQGLAEGLRAAGRTGQAQVASEFPGKTSLGQLSTAFHVRDGWIDLDQPLAFDAPFGATRLGGRISLEKQLDLNGQVVLSQQFVAQSLSGFNVPIQGPIELPLAVGGTLDSPRVKLPPPQQIAGQQLQEAIRRQARRFLPLPR